MALSISFNNVDRHTAIKLKKWILIWNNEKVHQFENRSLTENIHIEFVQIQHIYDWLLVHRLKKKSDCYIIVLLNQSLLYTAPLGVRLQIHDLFTYPVKESHFFRSIKSIYHYFSKEEGNHSDEQQGNPLNEQLESYYLRKIVQEDDVNEKYLLQALTHIDKKVFPNVVCFVQGFIHIEKIEELKHKAVQLIKSRFQKVYEPYARKLYFLPYENYLLVLFKLPDSVSRISQWKKGRQLFQQIINELLEEYRIQVTIGVGTCYSNPEKLHLSVNEARKARSSPPYEATHLRYFEEISTDSQMLRFTKYISENLEQELMAQDVANRGNLSYTYFCRYFKKEMGKGFSEYVTFARLQQAVWMLRHSNNTIEEISDYVGFNTPNYFSAMFKKYVSITPSEYRQTLEIKFL